MGVYKRYADTPGQILYCDGTSAGPEDYKQFKHEIDRLPIGSSCHWHLLLQVDSIIRLKANLKAVMDCMVKSSIMTVIPDGVKVNELKFLEELSILSPMSQVVGHELLNLRERQRFVDSFRIVFNAFRCERKCNGEAKGNGNKE